jgi:hypothetical protein
LTGSAVLADELPSPSLDNPCNPLEQASEALENMSNDLVLNWFQAGVCAEVEPNVPEITDYGDVIESFQTLLIHVDGEAIGYGAVTVLTDPATGISDMEMVVDDGGVNVQWTLRQTIWTSNGQVISLGTVEKFRVEPPEEVSYAGGWVYSPQNGPSEHPNSDAGFHAEVATMFGCDSTVAASSILGSALSAISNWLSNIIYYIRDRSIPWSNPTTCSGPTILDASGQSCENEDIPCRDYIAEMAKKIGSIPGVSTAFKKCMKGRFACGGSTFPRLRGRCAPSTNCGPCGSGPFGCSLAGRDLWYCDPSDKACDCIETIFHEAVHACNKGHSIQYYSQSGCSATGGPDDACRIGYWFRTKFIEQFGSCSPAIIPGEGTTEAQ